MPSTDLFRDNLPAFRQCIATACGDEITREAFNPPHVTASAARPGKHCGIPLIAALFHLLRNWLRGSFRWMQACACLEITAVAG